jgi:Heparinase II/III-like protein
VTVTPLTPHRSPLRQRLTALRGPGSQALVEALRSCPQRIPVPSAEVRTIWNAVDAGTRAALLAEADSALNHTAPVLSASDWARTFRDGVRTAYEDNARALREQTALLVTATVLADQAASATAPPGTVPYLDAAADNLVALLESSTWCWAPHERFAAARGEFLPDPDRPFLDLGAAEVALLVAWADHVLGARLESRLPGLRRRIRREVKLRVLDPFRQVRDWHWIGSDGNAHNWNAWIHHAVLTCALLLTDDEEERAELVRLVVEGLDHYLAVLPDDGGIDEGISYWWHGAGQLLESLDLLATVGGPALDARDLPVLAQLVRYPLRAHLGGPWYVNVGDAPARLPSDDQDWHVLHHWGRLLGDAEVAAHAAAAGQAAELVAHPQQGLGRALAALADQTWTATCSTSDASEPAGPGSTANSASQPWLGRQVWLPKVQLLVVREQAGTSAGLTIAAKGGHNAERHNHLDVGTFTVALDGRPMVVDVGKPTYTAASFGPDRYAAWPLQSQWHNVPEIAGAQQLPGEAHQARSVSATLSAETGELRADLAEAYPQGTVEQWWRTVRLVRKGAEHPAYALVQDEATVPHGGVLLRYVLAGEVDETDADLGRLHVRAQDGRALLLAWDPQLFNPLVEHRTLHDQQLRACWGTSLTRLTLQLRSLVAGDDLCAWLRLERAH